MEDSSRKTAKTRKTQAVPKVVELVEETKEQTNPVFSQENEKIRREIITGETIQNVRNLFLNPVDYALPEEIKTVRKAMLRNLTEARKKLQQRIPERITLNDMLLSSFNALLNQIQRAEMMAGDGERFSDERDAVWYVVQFEQCKLLSMLTDLPVTGEGITYDMADITFFLANSIDLDSEH